MAWASRLCWLSVRRGVKMHQLAASAPGSTGLAGVMPMSDDMFNVDLSLNRAIASGPVLVTLLAGLEPNQVLNFG